MQCLRCFRMISLEFALHTWDWQMFADAKRWWNIEYEFVLKILSTTYSFNDILVNLRLVVGWIWNKSRKVSNQRRIYLERHQSVFAASNHTVSGLIIVWQRRANMNAGIRWMSIDIAVLLYITQLNEIRCKNERRRWLTIWQTVFVFFSTNLSSPTFLSCLRLPRCVARIVQNAPYDQMRRPIVLITELRRNHSFGFQLSIREYSGLHFVALCHY